MDEPQDGVVYPLQLGNTFMEDSDQYYHTLQYNFKPASIDTKRSSGVLRKNEKGELEVEIVNKTTKNGGGNEKVVFKGNYAPSKEIECILVFEKATNSFRLERLAGTGKSLKAVRDDPKHPKSSHAAEMEAEADQLLPPIPLPTAPPAAIIAAAYRKRRSPIADYGEDESNHKKSKNTSPRVAKRESVKSVYLKDSPIVDEVIDVNMNGGNNAMSDTTLMGLVEDLENDMITNNTHHTATPASSKHSLPTQSIPTKNKVQPPTNVPQVASTSAAPPAPSKADSDSDSESASESESESSSSDSGSSSASDSDNEKKM